MVWLLKGNNIAGVAEESANGVTGYSGTFSDDAFSPLSGAIVLLMGSQAWA